MMTPGNVRIYRHGRTTTRGTSRFVFFNYYISLSNRTSYFAHQQYTANCSQNRREKILEKKKSSIPSPTTGPVPSSSRNFPSPDGPISPKGATLMQQFYHEPVL